MRDIGGYRFDETGLSQGDTGARLGEWRELTRIGATAASDGIRWAYTLVFVFADVSTVAVPVESSWLGRPQKDELAGLLQAALRHAPPTVEITSRARQVLAWGQRTELEHEQLRATRASEPDGRRLLEAAQWRWARLEHRQAARLARAATRRAPDEVEAWKTLLLIEVERGARAARVRALGEAVLARAPGDAEVRAILEEAAARKEPTLWQTTLRRLPTAAALVVGTGALSAAIWVKMEETREQEEAWQRVQAAYALKAERPEPLIEAEWQVTLGDLRGMMTLAEFHEKGMHGLKPDLKAAYVWWMNAAEGGHVPGMLAVSRALLSGEGVDKNLGEAQAWLTKAAEARSGEAAYLLGELFFLGKEVPQDYKASYRWYARSFELGYPEARGRLATHYEKGWGTKPNLVSAFALYRVLADRGDAWGASKVGYLLATGQGVERDEVAAVRWYRFAAEEGDATAQINLASALKDGRGVERNAAEALTWVEKAAAQGELTAGAVYADLLWRGDGVKQDRREAMSRVEALVAQGSAPARTLLGKFLVASGPQQDLARARTIFDQGAAAGSSADQAYHGLLCLEGIGGPRDAEAAMVDLELASKSWQPSAALFLAAARMGYGRPGATPDLAAARQAVRDIGEPGKDYAPYLESLREGGDVVALLAGKTPAIAAAPGDAAAPAEEALPKERAPMPLAQATPAYPMAGRVLEIDGEVLVEFIVGPTGRVISAHAVRSTLPMFEVAAISAVQQWRFKPGVKAGRAVPTRMQVPIRFSMNDEPKVTGVRLNVEQRAP